MKKPNSIRLTKHGRKRIDELIMSSSTNQYHKSLLSAIRDRADRKNLSRSDCEVAEEINKVYA